MCNNTHHKFINQDIKKLMNLPYPHLCDALALIDATTKIIATAISGEKWTNNFVSKVERTSRG